MFQLGKSFKGLTALIKGEKDSHAKIDNQLGSLDDVAGMTDEKDDGMEDTVCMDMFFTSR